LDREAQAGIDARQGQVKEEEEIKTQTKEIDGKDVDVDDADADAEDVGVMLMDPSLLYLKMLV